MISPCARALTVAVVTLAATRVIGAQTATAASARLDSTVMLYCAAWSTADRATRDQLLDRIWTDDGTHLDQGNTRADGRAALSDAIGRMAQRYPGAHFQCSRPQAHHDVMRFAWILRGRGNAEMLNGMDFAELAADGRIRRIVGFFGPLPSASP